AMCRTGGAPAGGAPYSWSLARHYVKSGVKKSLFPVVSPGGAEPPPFVVTPPPSDLRDRVRLVALLGAARSTTFEFHLTDWLARKERGASAATEPEIEKLRGLSLLCIYGTDEKDSVCPLLPSTLARVEPVQGGH